jgi:nanoRNase/pAp phosphatase (c-di-AMP/oligoRNAs hydrolase)
MRRYEAAKMRDDTGGAWTVRNVVRLRHHGHGTKQASAVWIRRFVSITIEVSLTLILRTRESAATQALGLLSINACPMSTCAPRFSRCTPEAGTR